MFAPNAPSIGVWELAIVGGILLLPLWLALGVWTFRDMRRRSRYTSWAVVAALVVLLLPIVGLVIYWLLRPRETLSEAYDRALQEEVWLQQIEAGNACPGCDRPVEANWLVCPECHVTLRHACIHCGAALRPHWQICPVCAHVVRRVEAPAVEEAPPISAS